MSRWKKDERKLCMDAGISPMKRPRIARIGKIRQAWLMVVLLCAWLVTPIRSTAEEIPFTPGERLVYKIKWKKIIIGEAVLDVLPNEIVANETAHHFYMTGKTSSFVDTFNKYRIEIDAYTRMDMARSVYYTSSDVSRKASETVILDFDWKNKNVLYTTQKEKKKGVEKKTKKKDIPLHTFDIFSAMYHLRYQMANLGNRTEIPTAVTNGRKVLEGKVYVIGKETVELYGQAPRETIHLQLNVDGMGDVRTAKDKSNFMDIWITDDAMKVPILIKGKVKIGHVVAELVTITTNNLVRMPVSSD